MPVDEWEILPSDSIEQRILAEGVESADAVVIVISELSINKPSATSHRIPAYRPGILDQTTAIV